MYMNIHARAYVQSVLDQHAHMISDGHASIDDVPVKVKTVCIKRFCRSSMSLIIVLCTLCCTTTHISQFQAQDNTGSF